MACLVEFTHRVAVASVDDVCLTLEPHNNAMLCSISGGGFGQKSTFCLCFIVLIAKAFNCAHKQQQETGIRDLGHHAAFC
jgi:hypothetical protein